MTLRRSITANAVALCWFLPLAASAQSWNSVPVRQVIDRAIARRARVQADSGLQAYRALARGFLFFLGQMGEGFPDPPRLIKSDQLALEVYWRAPDHSKQIIIGRRDRRDLPTDIQYHRDHLGIAQNNFGDQIRIGDGDEVSDVPHPLGPAGSTLYDYALIDSLSLELPDRMVRVYQVSVRPKDFTAPRLVGTLFIDVQAAELVRFRFSFTPAAYRDNTLEDVTVVLDNGLWYGRYWLPRRQELEIRRRTAWLDIPARGIIRGRWEIGSYEFNVPLPSSLFDSREPEVVSAPAVRRDSFPWDTQLDVAIRDALGPVERADLDRVRSELSRAVANRALSGLPGSRFGFGSLSDLVHVNRVEGLAPGFGAVVRPGHGRYELRGWLSRGFSDDRWKSRGSVSAAVGAWVVEAAAAREVKDIGDEPVISRALNSLLAQEGGYDFGDYVQMDQVSVGARREELGNAIHLLAAWEQAGTVGASATPATGNFRPNPSLGGPKHVLLRGEAGHHLPALDATIAAEAGLASGSDRYLRFRVSGATSHSLGSSEAELQGWAGWGSSRLPSYRSFVMGGRGSLPGEGFRVWGGKSAALARADWKVPIPFFALPLGAFGSTGNQAVGGIFLAAGWAGNPVSGVPWVPTLGTRTVAGVTLELFQRMLRAEVGVGLQHRTAGLNIDFRRDLWPIL